MTDLSLADIVRTADPQTLQRYAETLDDDDLALLEQTIADLNDPDGRRVYRQLGYEPICIPRVKAALAAGFANPIEAETAGAVLPAMCGTCPSERFETATEFDILLGGAAGAAKMLRVDEPVPIPDGWTTIGDLRPGDLIFDERGTTTHVTAVHPIDSHPVSYLLTFDDGSTIEACADHLWFTWNAKELEALTRRSDEFRARRRATRPRRGTGAKPWMAERNAARAGPVLDSPTGQVRTTKEIAETLLTSSGRRNHAMPVAAAIELPEIELPLDPYLLGAWLGDGTTGGGEITSADPEVLDAFDADGWKRGASKRRWPEAKATTTGFNGLRVRLREIGVLGNKHVPQIYLRASACQRLALLQGLMDTDGCCTERGNVAFSNTNRRIIDAVYELVVSLGWKTCIREYRAMLYGKDCGPVWSVRWTPTDYVFRLPRKRDRQVFSTRRTTRFRYVVGAEECEPSPMRCITVDNPTGLYLVGRSMLVTHNTLTALMFTLRCMARWPGFRALFLRETFDQLDENVYPELRKIDWAAEIGGKWNAGRRQLDIAASSCRFRYMADADDALQRRGGSYQLIVLDERNLLPVGTGDRLRDRLRSADPNIPVIGFRSTANPGGASHGELKSKFVRPDPRMVETSINEHGDTCTTVRQGLTSFKRKFIPAKATDNPYLGDEYFTDILGAIEDPILRRAMRDGDWDVFVGQYFQEFSHDRHVVPRGMVELDRGWTRYEGIDYGRAAPFCMLRAAIDGEGRAWLYREIYEVGLDEAVQAKMIREDEEAMGDRGAFRAADPSMWGKIGAALPFAETYRREGVVLAKADNDRVPGWSRVHSYLAETAPCGYHAGLGWQTCPKLHIIEGTCPNFERTLPDMIFDPHKVEDAWSGGDDHAPDAFRYLVSHPRLTRGPARISVPGPQHVR